MDLDPRPPAQQPLVARIAPPKTTLPSYFEFVENKDKKKKLEFKVPPPDGPVP